METKNLIGHLKKEAELLKDLIQVLHKETECIVSRDYKALYETVGAKEHLVMRVNAAGGARNALIAECFAALGGSSNGEASLSSVIELAGANGIALDECRTNLLSLASTVKDINSLNSIITESSMQNVTKTLGFLGNFVQKSTYKATGSFDGFALKGSRLSEGA